MLHKAYKYTKLKGKNIGLTANFMSSSKLKAALFQKAS